MKTSRIENFFFFKIYGISFFKKTILFGFFSLQTYYFKTSANHNICVHDWLRFNSFVGPEKKTLLDSKTQDLLNIGTFKAIRKSYGYPVNGQRTRSNAKTARKNKIF